MFYFGKTNRFCFLSTLPEKSDSELKDLNRNQGNQFWIRFTNPEADRINLGRDSERKGINMIKKREINIGKNKQIYSQRENFP